MNRVIAVVGPTASGKSGFSVQLAKQIGAEIISADSMQIYRRLDIGTAKITYAEMQGVPHHLLDVVEPNATFSVQQYQQLAQKVLCDLQTRKVMPVITGGTGLYLQSLLFDLDFGRAKPDPAIRKELEILDAARLYEQLQRKSPELAQTIHPNNRKRVIRALEIVLSGKNPKRDRFDTPRKDLSAVILGLEVPRDLLHRRIEQRVDRMLAEGLIEECEQQLLPFGRQTQAAAAIGYAETIDYLHGLCTRDELRKNIVVHTRQYAKRQMTWFRRMNVRWIPYDTDPKQIAKELV